MCVVACQQYSIDTPILIEFEEYYSSLSRFTAFFYQNGRLFGTA